MAGVNNLLIAVAVFLSMSLFTCALDLGAPTSAQEPRPGLFNFLDVCASHATKKCGNEIFKSVFLNGTLSHECCVELVSTLGKSCHDEMVSYIAHGPNFEARLQYYLAKSQEVYIGCFPIPKAIAN